MPQELLRCCYRRTTCSRDHDRWSNRQLLNLLSQPSERACQAVPKKLLLLQEQLRPVVQVHEQQNYSRNQQGQPRCVRLWTEQEQEPREVLLNDHEMNAKKEPKVSPKAKEKAINLQPL